VLVAIAMVIGSASCIKDDLSDCFGYMENNVRLTVRLDVDATARNAVSESYRIDSTHVYVFDATGRFVTSAAGGVYDPTKAYEFFFTLEGGDYHFVVWSNPGEIYKTNHAFEQSEAQELTMDDLIYYMDVSVADCLTKDIIPDLLYGTQLQEIISNQNNLVTVDMIPDTYRVNIEVTGLPQIGDDFEFTITDNNSHYKFDNSIIPDMDDFTYMRVDNQSVSIDDPDERQLNVSFKVLRLIDGRSPGFLFTNRTDGDILYHDNLIETIRRAYEQSGQTLDFDKTHTFDIKLTFNIDMGVSVSVNGWEYTQQSNEL